MKVRLDTLVIHVELVKGSAMYNNIKVIFFTLVASIVLQKASAVTYVASEPVVFEGSPVTVYPNGQVLCAKNEKGPEGRSNRRLLLYNLEKKEELSLKITPLTERVHQLSFNGQALFVIDGDSRRLFFHKKKMVNGMLELGSHYLLGLE